MILISNLKNNFGPSNDYKIRLFNIDKQKVYFIYNEVLTNKDQINNLVIRKILLLNKRQLKKLDNHIPDISTIIINEKDILTYLNNGYLIIIYKKNYACEIKSILDRGITTIESELAFNGPKDSFCETFNTNLGLIRKRIKSCDLYCDNIEVGRSTKTRIGLLYMNNIVKQDLVKQIKLVLNKIDIDGIIDSSYLKTTLEERKNFFPTIMMSERPDKSCMALLEGKVVILVDTSPYALILPSFFIDFFHTADDYYQKRSNATFIRIVRVLAFLIALFLPALYISVTTRNYNLVPLPLLLMLKAGRTFVPFPAYIEALFMIICFEILKESDLRVSQVGGSAVSILGGLILGDAAVAAGIVSPIMIIIIAISSIAGLIFTSQELVNALRIYKIALLILSTLLGIYGVIIGTILLAYNLLTVKIFGLNYLTTLIPFEKNEIKDSFIKLDSHIKMRNSFLTKNIVRGKYK